MTILNRTFCLSGIGLTFALLLTFFVPHAATASTYFTKKFSGKTVPGREASNPNASEDLKLVRQCVQKVCAETPSTNTFEAIEDRVQKKALASSYFDKEIWPTLLKRKEQDLRRHQDTINLLAHLKDLKEDLHLTENQRLLGFVNLESNSEDLFENLPLKKKTLKFGPLLYPLDISYLKSRTLDEATFFRMKKEGYFKGVSLELARVMARNNDSRRLYPLFGSNDNLIFSLLDNQGPGARRYLLKSYQEELSDLDSWATLAPVELFKNIKSLVHYLTDFISNHFDLITKMSAFTNKELGFTSSVFTFHQMNRLLKSISETSVTQLRSLPSKITINQINIVKERLGEQIKRDRDLLMPKNYSNSLKTACKAKINHLQEALPTDDELKRAEQIVNEASVEFMYWLYSKYSKKTASALFDFLKSWQFYYPPTKSQLSVFLKKYLAIDFEDRPYNTLKHLTPVYAMGILYDSEEKPKVRSSVSTASTIEFCNSLNNNPVSDRTQSRVGQVFLGWMSINNHDLLKSVVWHELGHILSTILKGDTYWDFSKHLMNEIQTNPVSLESFKQYSQTRQCLARQQTQAGTLTFLGETHYHWFKQGHLTAGVPVTSLWQPQPKDIQMEHLSMTLKDITENLEKFTLIPPVFYEKVQAKINKNSVLSLSGKKVEEDWADWVAGQVNPDTNNQFCFFLKDREHLHSDFSLLTLGTNIGKEHSNILYRLFHRESYKNKNLPEPCKELAKRSPLNWRFERCE